MAVSAKLPHLLPRPSVSPLRCVKGSFARLQKPQPALDPAPRLPFLTREARPVPSAHRHRSAPRRRRRGSAKPRSVTAYIVQIPNCRASPGSVSASEKGSGFVSVKAFLVHCVFQLFHELILSVKMSSATVFDVSMFTQVDGVSAGSVRNAPPVTLVIIYDNKTQKAKRFQLPATHHS